MLGFALRAAEVAKKTLSTIKQKAEKKPIVSEEVVQEIILITIIVNGWLTKISRKRWGAEGWERRPKPTQETLDRRSQKGETLDADLIYPGNTFEVIP